MTRYPQLDLGSFIALCPTRQAARKASRFAGTEFNKAEAEGLSVEQADRIACRIGRHPAEVWDCWSELNTAEVSKQCVGCERPFVPSVKVQRYCSKNCSKAAWSRRKYATDPAFAAADIAKGRAYYRECGDYARAMERRRYWQRKAVS